MKERVKSQNDAQDFFYPSQWKAVVPVCCDREDGGRRIRDLILDMLYWTGLIEIQMEMLTMFRGNV